MEQKNKPDSLRFGLTFAVLLLLSSMAGAESIIFLHHSVGYDLIEYGDVREGLTARGHTFYDHGYNWEGLRLADGSYPGTNFAVPGDNTDPDGFATIFSQPLHSPPDNTFSYLMQYDVIIFKSCFSASYITSDAQLDDYKVYYRSIRDRADSYPNKLFIIVTPPPRHPHETGDERAAYAARARAFANWLKSDEFLAGHPNIVTFDLFNYLAASDNFLRSEYRTSDSHPNGLADETIGPIFVNFVDTSIDNFSPAAPTCSDSDGGRIYATLGTTINSSGTSSSDSCLADGRLTEYYCSGTAVVSEAVSCSAGYVCSSGRCVSAPAPTCTDSDSGRIYTTSGTTTNSSGSSGSDVCLADGRLSEYYCSGTAVTSETVSCSTGYVCSSGRCVASAPAPTCSDSDSGRVYTTSGTTTNSSGTSNSDSCLADGRLTEYYCSGTAVVSEAVSCSAGYACSSGRCVLSGSGGSGSVIIDFETSDRSWERWDGSSSSMTCARTSVTSHGGSWSLDGTYNVRAGQEVTCGTSFDGTTDMSSGTGLSFWYRSGYAGRNVKFTVFSGNPSDPTPFEARFVTSAASTSGWDQISFRWSEFIKAPWAWQPDTAVNPARVTSISFGSDTASSNSWYIDDVALLSSTPAPICSDSDSGRAYGTIGTANDSAGTRGTDTCLADGRLREYYCAANNTVTSETVSCSSGYVCSSGRCVASTPAPTCNDTDGGRTYTTSGTTTNSSGSSGSDVCLADGRLSEYYCSGTAVTSETVSCSSGYVCSSGRCVLSIPGPSSGLIQPSDIEYLGAFKLPGPSGGSEWTWGAGSSATYYPNGDARGSSDGFPGSLYAVGHDHQQMVSEISIPAPVNSRNLADLNTATTIQPFSNVRQAAFPSIPDFGYSAIAYLPAQGAQTSGKLYLAWGFHFFDSMSTNTHSWSGLDLSSPGTAAAWGISGYTPYATTDYLFEIPSSWASVNTPGMRLATGRFREGYWSGRGPALFVYGPWNQGNPPAGGSAVPVVPLLLYGTQVPGVLEITSDATREVDNFCPNDRWSGGAWLTSGNRSSVIFVGTKGNGRCWYGFSDGTVWSEEGPYPPVPPSPHDDRGYWSEGIDAQMIFYGPADLAAVAAGDMETWEPQPYAVLNLTRYMYDPGFDYEREKDLTVGDIAFDRENGLLYLFEQRVEGLDEASIVHVFRLNGGTSAENHLPAVSNVRLSASSTPVTTYSDLLLSWNVSDADGDRVKNITTWNVNRAPMTVLNLPFEANGAEAVSSKDYSGNGRNASVTGATWDADAGVDGFGAYHFGETGQELSLARDSGYLENYTLIVELKRDHTGNYFDIFAGGGNAGQYFGFNNLSTDRIIVSYRNPARVQKTCYSNRRINDTEWHHVVVTGESSGYIRIYIDGVQDNIVNCRQPIDNGGFNPAYSTLKYLGNHHYVRGYEYEGFMDELKLYDKVLSPEQVRELYERDERSIVNSETKPGDVWSACVTPNDGTGDGTEVCSGSLSVEGNSVPVTSNVRLSASSTPVTTYSDLLLSWNVSDADGDRVKNITTWNVNGAQMTVLNLPFEASSNSVRTYDYASGSYRTVNGAVWVSNTGHDGFGAYSFSNDDNVLLGSGTGYMDSYTMHTRLKRDHTGQWDIFASGSNSAQYFGIHPVVADRVLVSYRNTLGAQMTCYSNGRISDTSWHHIAVTGESDGYIRIYLDGVQDPATYCRHPYNNGGFGNYSLVDHVGRHRSAAGLGFDGTLDDFQVFDRVLSAGQIAAIYANSARMVSNETNAGDVWSACVTSFDNTGAGEEVCSNELTISS